MGFHASDEQVLKIIC